MGVVGRYELGTNLGRVLVGNFNSTLRVCCYLVSSCWLVRCCRAGRETAATVEGCCFCVEFIGVGRIFVGIVVF